MKLLDLSPAIEFLQFQLAEIGGNGNQPGAGGGAVFAYLNEEDEQQRKMDIVSLQAAITILQAYQQEKKNECSGDPNPETIAAMNEDITNRPRFNNVASLMEYLNSDGID